MMKDLQSIISQSIDNKPMIIAGPCSAETEEQVMNTAINLANNGIKYFRAGIWKPRTKPGGFEGRNWHVYMYRSRYQGSCRSSS